MKKGDSILDIGSNDGTFLNSFQKNINKYGVDPTGKKFKKYYDKNIKLIPKLFNDNVIKNKKIKFKLISSIAMFYDLPNPRKFCSTVGRYLDKEGIFHVEVAYLPDILKKFSFDTFCQEHLTYFSFLSFHHLIKQTPFKITDFSRNSINGGSINFNLAFKDSKIKIYDVEFSPGVLDELLNLVISKTEYDFTQHRLSRNNKNVSCRFTMRRIIYENNPQGEIENWNMANGKIIFNGADVVFNGNWRMGGISGDPSYLEDEVNLKLTENGHLVGKMAYFNLTVKDGEAPRNPLYPALKEHKRSIPIELKKDSIKSKQFIDVEDWAGAVLFVNNCNDI